MNGSRIKLEMSKGCKDKYRDFQRTGRVRLDLKNNTVVDHLKGHLLSKKCPFKGSFGIFNLLFL